MGPYVILHLSVYLRTTPSVAYGRVMQRSRNEEGGGVSLEYLTQLHGLHEEWINRQEALNDLSDDPSLAVSIFPFFFFFSKQHF